MVSMFQRIYALRFYEKEENDTIRKNMKEKGITTHKIAKDLNFTPSYINRMIRGDSPVSDVFEKYLKEKSLI